MRLPTNPWYIVCLRERLAGEDDYLGPFRTYEAAQRVRDRLNRDLEARGVLDTWDAHVEEMRPASDVEEFRDEMLRSCDAAGYLPIPVAERHKASIL